MVVDFVNQLLSEFTLFRIRFVYGLEKQMDFSTFLSRHLEHNQMSYSDLVRELELRGFSFSKAAIGHWRSGKNNPPLEDPVFRAALAHALRTDVNRMMTQLGYIQYEDDHSSEARIAAELIDQMPEGKRAAALKILEQLVAL
jgi:hypothetical protein